MFSGIIEQIGKVECLNTAKSEPKTSTGLQIKVYCNPLGWGNSSHENLTPPVIGESIAVDGVCLTAIRWDDDGFIADLSPETLRVIKPYFSETHTASTPVNLERAMRYGQLVGGHLVSGHVDGVGEVVVIDPTENFSAFTFRVPNTLAPLIVQKGCITINGCSLTVNAIEGNCFTVMIIPHTLEHTNIQMLSVGGSVNIEVDLMAKYIVKSALHAKNQDQSTNDDQESPSQKAP